MNITNDDNIKAWEKESDYVIEKFTDSGDFYRQYLLNPALFSLLGEVKGKSILDAGSGEGYLSRLLAQKGAKMTAVEPATGLINHAIERERKDKLGITYIQADLSKWHGKPTSFDIVISNMVFMDIPDYQSAIRNCIQVLKQSGLFVFSISHPCFDVEGKWEQKPYVKVKNYFDEYKIQNYIGYSFHHMLSDYLNLIIEEGCNIQRILEPKLPDNVAKGNKNHIRDRRVPNFLVVKAIKR